MSECNSVTASVCYLPQRDGGRQWMVVEFGALWLWVKALWWLLGATETGVRSVCGPAGSGSCTGHIFIVGLGTGVPWMGGDGHGEPRGDMLEGGRPKQKKRNTEFFWRIQIYDNISVLFWPLFFHVTVPWHIFLIHDLYVRLILEIMDQVQHQSKESEQFLLPTVTDAMLSSQKRWKLKNTHLIFLVVCCKGGWKSWRQHRKQTWSGSLRWSSSTSGSMNHCFDKSVGQEDKSDIIYSVRGWGVSRITCLECVWRWRSDPCILGLARWWAAL